jgi:hypothetical protein
VHVYDLTNLTRGASEQRRVVIQSFDVPLQSFVLVICGAIAALPFVAVLFPLFGFFALFSVAMVEVAVFWLFRWRSRSGLRLKNYQAILDRRRSHVGQILVCGYPYDFTSGLAITVVSSSLPRARPIDDASRGADSVEDLFSLDH